MVRTGFRAEESAPTLEAVSGAWRAAIRVVSALAGSHGHISSSCSGGRACMEVICGEPFGLNKAASEARTTRSAAGFPLPSSPNAALASTARNRMPPSHVLPLLYRAMVLSPFTNPQVVAADGGGKDAALTACPASFSKRHPTRMITGSQRQAQAFVARARQAFSPSRPTSSRFSTSRGDPLRLADPHAVLHGDGHASIAGFLALGSGAVFLEMAQYGRWKLQSELVPARHQPVIDLTTNTVPLRKLFQIFMFLAGIDQSLGTVGPFLRRILRGIEIGRPGGAQYIDVGGGIRARGHRPQHLVNVGRIDVLINDNDVLGVVGARRKLGGQRSGLGGVPGITLLNRNGGGPEPPGRFRERENALNSGDPQPFEIGPDSSGTNDAEQQTLLAGGVVRHQRASQNGIAAVAHAFHIDNGRS